MGHTDSSHTPHVIMIGSLDTKGDEYGFVRTKIEEGGCAVTVIDCGILGAPTIEPDISRREVAEAGGGNVESLAATLDRGIALTIMSAGATTLVTRLFRRRMLDGVLGLGGSAGATIISSAMRALPHGVPKLLVTTMASGDTRPYVGVSDLTLMHPVADIAGLNRITEPILRNAAAAIVGMAKAYATSTLPISDKPTIAATMLGVTTLGVNAARRWLEDQGYEVLVFHANGAGGAAMESLIREGLISGVLDMTTAELADELGGGVMSAGPDRLEAASNRGIPQVVSLGGLQAIKLGPVDQLPEHFRNRRLEQITPALTAIRTTPKECAQLGRIIATKLNSAVGPVSVFIPANGIASSAVEGQPFYDPDADQALFNSVKANLRSDIEIQTLAMDINDTEFGERTASWLHEHMLRTSAPEKSAP